MAKTLADWIAETAWMPALHSDVDHLWFCGHLIETQQVWVTDCRDGLGFLALNTEEITALYLPQALRNQGWGNALLTAVKATQSRLTLWTFQANTDALRFYQTHGFRVAGFTDGSGNDEKLADAHLIWERNV
jgi:GNAT superfamily N-acetyltransferase